MQFIKSKERSKHEEHLATKWLDFFLGGGEHVFITTVAPVAQMTRFRMNTINSYQMNRVNTVVNINHLKCRDIYIIEGS